jgi:hypothetical protein
VAEVRGQWSSTPPGSSSPCPISPWADAHGYSSGIPFGDLSFRNDTTTIHQYSISRFPYPIRILLPTCCEAKSRYTLFCQRHRRKGLRFYPRRCLEKEVLLTGLIVLRENVIKPVLAGAGKPRLRRPSKVSHPLDVQYMNLHREMRRTLQMLGLAA